VRFQDNSRLVLENAGYLIYPLTGVSVSEMIERGRADILQRSWEKAVPQELFSMTSRKSEVAIPTYRHFEDPKLLLLAGLGRITGNIADYLELFNSHLEVTGEYLGIDYQKTKVNGKPTLRRISRNIKTRPSINGFNPTLRWQLKPGHIFDRFNPNTESSEYPRMVIMNKYDVSEMPIIVPAESLSNKEIKAIIDGSYRHYL
jgi:hypothetical protein